MKFTARPFIFFSASLIFVMLAAVFTPAPCAAEDYFAGPLGNQPVPVIFDTDLGNDADDALALAILHNMQTRGKCRILGVTLTKDHPDAARLAYAINTFYGRPEIPVGAIHDGATKEAGQYLTQTLATKNADGTLSFPVAENFAPADSVALLRKLLATAEDNSVVIIQVGFSTNLARLLDTPGDAISPLDGKTLAAQKVRLLSIMAGDFRDGGTGNREHAEYNVGCDIPSATKMYPAWPGEAVFSGFEVAEGIHMQPVNMLNDYSAASRGKEKHIIQEAYRHYRGLESSQPTWDLTSVLYVLRPEPGRGYFSLSQRGTVTVNSRGITIFTPSEDGKHRYFQVDHDQRTRTAEAFVNLCSE